MTNLKLAELYEKLGDLKKSEELYKKADEISPGDLSIQTKINDLDLLNYEKSEYYHTIRE